MKTLRSISARLALIALCVPATAAIWLHDRWIARRTIPAPRRVPARTALAALLTLGGIACSPEIRVYNPVSVGWLQASGHTEVSAALSSNAGCAGETWAWRSIGPDGTRLRGVACCDLAQCGWWRAPEGTR
jgi:hypothetical protein